MAKSLRRRLQGWYALVVGGVIAAFAAVLYIEVRRSAIAELDTDLMSAANSVDGILKTWPYPDLVGLERPFGKGRPPWPPKKGGPFEKEGFPPDKGPPPGAFIPLEQRRNELAPLGWSVPTGEDSGRFFGVWQSDGTVIRQDGVPKAWRLSDQSPPTSGAAVSTSGEFRQVVMLGPHQTIIAIGRSTKTIDRDLRLFAGKVAGIGVVALAAAITGGWWITSRVLRPIDQFAETASQISVSNLSERIETDGIESELVGLADTLNGMFHRLESAFGELSRFTADASHELRTPLAIIKSNVELALLRPRSGDEYRETLQNCLKAVGRMNSVVDGLLTLARMEADQQAAPRRPLDLAKLAEETVDFMRPRGQERGITLRAETKSTVVIGDPDALNRVIGNLVENAIRYNRDGGKVVVTVAHHFNEAVLFVSDTGIGIPEDDLSHVFDRFFRVDKARSRASGGVGLGLAICKSIIDAHHGKISVDSTVGRGTVFRIELPLVSPDRLKKKKPAVPGNSRSAVAAESEISEEHAPETDRRPTRSLK